MKIVLGTTSDLKIRAAKEAFKILGINPEIITVKSESGVANQPFGLDQILTGAKNRAKNALQLHLADLGIGIENGIIKIDQINKWMETLAVAVIDGDGKESFALGSAYPLPDWVVKKIHNENSELGHVIQKLDPKLDKDPINYFSDGKIKREDTITQAIVFAMLEIVNGNQYVKP